MRSWIGVCGGRRGESAACQPGLDAEHKPITDGTQAGRHLRGGSQEGAAGAEPGTPFRADPVLMERNVARTPKQKCCSFRDVSAGGPSDVEFSVPGPPRRTSEDRGVLGPLRPLIRVPGTLRVCRRLRIPHSWLQFDRGARINHRIRGPLRELRSEDPSSPEKCCCGEPNSSRRDPCVDGPDSFQAPWMRRTPRLRHQGAPERRFHPGVPRRYIPPHSRAWSVRRFSPSGS